MLFFIVTFHQIVFYSLCFGRSWLLIHLMLKLIAVGVALGGLAARFNTSHVKVNRIWNKCQNTGKKVSIHPMLKLIRNIPLEHGRISRFNTSHVKVNHLKTTWTRLKITSFNTSHVKVNQNHNEHTIKDESFQYIPC